MIAPQEERGTRPYIPGGGKADSERQRPLDELRVRQVELEMQNQELREANLRLGEAARRYRELYDFAPVAYFALDPKGGILEANLAAVEVLGRPRSEILGKSLYLLLPKEDRDILYRHLRSVFGNREAHTCIFRLKAVDRQERYFRFQSHRYDGSPDTPACRSVAVDISLSKKIQDKLSAANRLKESILQSVEESLLVLDVRLRVISANAAFYKTFRLDPSRIEGRTIWQLGKGRRYQERLREHLQRMTSHRKAFDGLELTAEFPGIGRRELEIGARHLKGSDASSRRILLSIRDLTERKRAERRMQRALRRLEEANHQLSQFASVVSHDLKNPLRAIANYAGFLQQDLAGSLPEEQRSYLEGIQAAVELAEEQVTGLLELSRIRESELDCRKIKLGNLLSKLVGTTTAAKRAQIGLHDHWPTIVTEPTLLRQVISNLLDNAIKYNPSKTKKIELGWTEQPERHVELFVRDNGPGIAPEHQEKIFLAFRRLHSRKTVEGSGLGLSIVRTAVDRLGGSIRLESEVGKGSTFYVRLPVDGPEAEHMADRQV
jgi:PAS domain S-box-containing protein